MLFKNSLKLLTSNFNVVWKHMVYVLLTVLISVGLVFAFSGPFIECLEVSGWLGKSSTMFKTLYTDPIAIFDVVKEVALSFVSVIYHNLPNIWFSLIGMILTAYFVPSFLLGIGQYNVSSIIEKRMTSLLSVGYTQNLIGSLRSSAKYSAVKMLIQLPFDIMKVLLIVSLFKLATSFFTNLIFLSLLSALLIVVNSLQYTVLSGFAPSVISDGGNVFKCFARGFVPVFKNFIRVFGNMIVLYLTIVFVNMLLGLFTVFSSLLVSLPASIVLISIFGEVTYLSTTKKRYYLSASIIVNPLIDDSKIDNSYKG